MKNIIYLALLLLSASSVHAQEKKWHELEGVFQSPNNKDMYVRFTAGDSLLIAHLLWNNGELHLLPDTGLAFVSRESEDGGPIHITFQRDPSGAVNRVNVAGREVWARAANYKAVSKVEMPHTPAQLQKFIGLYHFSEDTSQFIRLTVDSNTLTIHQQWDGGFIDNFAPESELMFFKKERPIMTLKFTQDPQGQITQFVAFGRDTWIRTAAASVSAGRLKTYEGKFRSADDPDNQVQLIAAGNELVVRELWNKKEIALQPLNNSYFVDKDQSFSLRIILGDDGRPKEIVLLGNQRFVRIE